RVNPGIATRQAADRLPQFANRTGVTATVEIRSRVGHASAQTRKLPRRRPRGRRRDRRRRLDVLPAAVHRRVFGDAREPPTSGAVASLFSNRRPEQTRKASWPTTGLF